MLVGAILGSVVPHARLVRVDTTRAEQLPGVRAVLSGRDVPPTLTGASVKDTTLLAFDRVRYIGEPIVAVAAIDQDTAQEALSLVEVEYEELPAVFDPLRALEDTSVLVHPDLERYAANPKVRRWGNVCSHTGFLQGQPETAFAAARHVFEDTFSTQMQHQAYLEPTSALADVDATGRITLWASTKTVYGCQAQVAELLGLPASRLRVIAPSIGGSFGGKGDVTIEAICAGLARAAGRPVRLVMTREQEMLMGRPRHAESLTIRTALDDSGRILACQMRIIYDTGAYAATGPHVTALGTASACGPYAIPNVRLDGYCVYTNKVPCGAFRGFGAPQAHFATESHLDMVAEQLGLDPLELRLRNAVQDGWTAPSGERLEAVGLSECLRQAAERIGWERRPARGSGRGMSVVSVARGTGMLSAGAEVRLQQDGSAVLEIAAVDVGQGSDTVLCSLVADVLGLPVERVSIGPPDTLSSPWNWSTAGSRVTSTAGRAVLEAARDLADQIRALAARTLEAATDDLELAEGAVRVKGAPQRALPLAAVVGMSHYVADGPLCGRGRFAVAGHAADASVSCEGFPAPIHEAVAYGAAGIEVQVDRDTGQITIERIVAVHDVGTAVFRQGVEGQIEGAAMQGVGYALSEEIVLQDGAPQNTRLSDYLVPLATNAPPVEAVIVEGFCPPGPLGAKGVGEHALLGIAPATANAVTAACGARVTSLPLSPEKVLSALSASATGPAPRSESGGNNP
jgi:carbon-monoxide dehydrogenase large subunit